VTPLPPPLGSGDLVFWRLDLLKFKDTWDRGEGSYRAGGRWSSRGTRAVYGAVDPATSILEVAVHKTFEALDTVPHILTWAQIMDLSSVRIVDASEVPNPNWLRPGAVSAGQQAFGDNLLKANAFVLMPSVVSSHSWIVVFDPAVAQGSYDLLEQEPFALDTRLHLPRRVQGP
jgi:RES domain-containing protein